MPHLTSDVLIVGAGGAGMYAAIAAARHGASVILLDKSLVGSRRRYDHGSDDRGRCYRPARAGRLDDSF